MEYKRITKQRINQSRFTFNQETVSTQTQSNIFSSIRTENNSPSNQKLIDKLNSTKDYNLVGNKDTFIKYLKSFETN